MSKYKAWLGRLAFLLYLTMVISAPLHAEGYVLGQGVSVGDFVVSGYANAVAESPHGGASRLSADDLSLFVSGQMSRWINPFVEAEISESTLVQSSDGPRQKAKFVPERIYNDARITQADTLRVGKILTPVGDWNLIHAAPLVATVIRPLTTNRGFAEYATGVSWLHESPGAGVPDWQVYAQPGTEWLPRPDSIAPRHYRKVWGGHLNWGSGISDKVGISLQHGELAGTGESYTLAGANLRRTFGRLMLETEATEARWSGSESRERGGYALAAYAINDRWRAILESEYFRDHLLVGTSRNLLVGINYKPVPALVWKLEYVHQAGVPTDIPSGWRAALSVLF